MALGKFYFKWGCFKINYSTQAHNLNKHICTYFTDRAYFLSNTGAGAGYDSAANIDTMTKILSPDSKDNMCQVS